MGHVRHGKHTCSSRRQRLCWYLWDMTHSYVGHVSFICGTWLIHKCSLQLMAAPVFEFMRQNSFISATCLIRMWDTSHSYVGHDSSINARCSWRQRLCSNLWSHKLDHVPHLNEVCPTCHDMWDIPHLNVGHDSFINTYNTAGGSASAYIHATRLICMRDMAHSYIKTAQYTYIRHDSFLCGTWLMHT